MHHDTPDQLAEEPRNAQVSARQVKEQGQCAFGMSRAIWAAKRVTARGVGST
jgi:hypothetical protein